jgi:CubicO group peptidase (beta-lactamase class C family)
VAVEADFQRLIEEAAVPSVAAAVVRGDRLEQILCCGLRSANAPELVDENTVFDAASLTKPVFAHAVLQLADQGWLLLDTPLFITFRVISLVMIAQTRSPLSMCLPTAPDCRTDAIAIFRLKIYFEPGEQFSYSGEGYLYLQKAIEKITGEKAHALVDELAFRPLGMTRSSLIWDIRFDLNRAYPHDAFGRPALGGKPGEANAAWSLQTTAVDFAFCSRY